MKREELSGKAKKVKWREKKEKEDMLSYLRGFNLCMPPVHEWSY